MLPNDFGTTPAADAGIPGLNIAGDPFTSGLPCFDINGGTAQMRFGSGLDAGRCNCPLAQDEKQWQVVVEPHEGVRQPHREVRHRHPARLQPARAERRTTAPASSTSTTNGTRGPDGGGLGLATFLLGNVNQQFARYVSSSTDARERQWRQFFYAQDTWRASRS